jgi:hypothetical protein
MDINFWISRISEPRSELAGLSVCPYAKGAKYEIIDTDGSDIDPPPWKFDLIIYRLPDNYTTDDVDAIADAYNKLFPDMVFLPDPKNCDTEINTVKTNNGKYNLILCQWRDELEAARSKLKKTNYYSHWSQEYLSKILNT